MAAAGVTCRGAHRQMKGTGLAYCLTDVVHRDRV
jgi:hypothetical protein